MEMEMEMEMEAKNNAGVGAGTGTGRRTRMNLQMPIGYRFCPTDQELIIHYLRPKVFNFPLPAQDAILHSHHLFLHHPSHLPGDLKEKRYFFCKNMFPAKTEAGVVNSSSGGYWKPIVNNNNTHKLILAPGCNHPIGLKRCYVFYQFRESHSLRAFKTPWILNEFRLLHSHYLYPLLFKMDRGNVEEWTVCSIHMKKKKKKRKARNQDKGSAKRHKKTEVIKPIVIDDFSSPVEDTNGYGPAGQPASSSSSGITVLSHHHDLDHEQEESSITHHR